MIDSKEQDAWTSRGLDIPCRRFNRPRPVRLSAAQGRSSRRRNRSLPKSVLRKQFSYSPPLIRCLDIGLPQYTMRRRLECPHLGSSGWQCFQTTRRNSDNTLGICVHDVPRAYGNPPDFHGFAALPNAQRTMMDCGPFAVGCKANAQ